MFRYVKQQALTTLLVVIGSASACVSLVRDLFLTSPPSLVATLWHALGAGLTPAAVVLFIFNKWAWKWPIFSVMMKVPRIEGTWVGKEKSLTFGQDQLERSVVVRILQSPTDIFYTAHNETSINRSASVDLAQEETTRDCTLLIAYRNEGTAVTPQRHTLQHYGACRLILSAPSRDPSTWTLSGRYWTDKLRDANDPFSGGTTGTLKLEFRNRKPVLYAPSQHVDAASNSGIA